MKEDISLLQAQLAYKKQLQAVQKELVHQRQQLQQKVAELERNMHSEKKDVDRLEGRSLTAFVFLLMGTREEKLDAERREYYAARIKYDAAVRELHAVSQDLEATEEDLKDLENVEEQYAQVIDHKRLAIEHAGTRQSGHLLEKEARLSGLHNQGRELEEAISAGTAALRTVAELVQDLNNIKEWGGLELPGGGFLADMAKHEMLDQAQKNVEQLQVQLQRFNKELSDVPNRSNLQVSMDAMLRFADSFFENLSLEMAVVEHIKESQRQLDQTRDLILGILRRLQTQLEEVRHGELRVRAEVDELIVTMEL